VCFLDATCGDLPNYRFYEILDLSNFAFLASMIVSPYDYDEDALSKIIALSLSSILAILCSIYPLSLSKDYRTLCLIINLCLVDFTDLFVLVVRV